VSEKRLHRDRNGDIDSGVYSENSSRDGTPIRGHLVAGEGTQQHAGLETTVGGDAPRIRSRSKVVSSHSSPKRKSADSATLGVMEQNGLHGPKHNSFSDVGQSKYKSHSKIDPASLNLVSKAIEHSPEVLRKGSPKSPRRRISVKESDEWSSRRVVKRSSSDKPVTPRNSNPNVLVGLDGGGKNSTQGETKVRSVQVADSSLNSPEDIKLVSPFPLSLSCPSLLLVSALSPLHISSLAWG
jgi:hypothetical protein